MTIEPRSLANASASTLRPGRALLALPALALLLCSCVASIADEGEDTAYTEGELDDGEGEKLPELVDDLTQDQSDGEDAFWAVGVWASGLSGVSGNNWMSAIDSSRLLSDLTIPGTHDSMAFYEPVAGTAKCQSMPLNDQLYAGVRFLDIRCRHYGDSFTIHHGSIYQKANFDDVLNVVIAFLDRNPSEAVIMSVKEEHTPANNTRSFEQTFDSYVQKNPGKWNFSEHIPTLGEARGKITLFRRYGGSPRGLNAANGWADKATFSMGASIRVQDNYAVSSTNTKWNQIKSLLDEAYSGSPSTLYVNFTSGVGSIFGIPNITGVSRPINQKANSFFTSASGRYGIIVADFIDYPYAAKIFNSNSQ